ncbi:LysR family transcriptional regulator [Pseudomonas sp. 3A(2025)]
MQKDPYSELLALIAVARERSFTKAAAQLQMSQSMLSHTISKLEARLGVRLLNRTTRSVSVTEAGQRLLDVVTPQLRDIEAELRAIAQSADVAAGTLRLNATEHAIDTLLWPRLSPLLAAHPQLNIELCTDYGPADNAQGRYDVEVRLGDELSKDTGAIRIGPNVPMVLVCAPAYLAAHTMPDSPQDLASHFCIGVRPATRGAQPVWWLGHERQPIRVAINARLTLNNLNQVVKAALSGHGLAYVPLDLAQPHLDSGRLLAVMPTWWRTVAGYHLYRLHQGEMSRTLHLLIETLQYNG